VLLVLCVFEKCNFIFMRSTNLDRFQLTALVLMRIACRPIEGGVVEGGRVFCGRQRKNARGKGTIFFGSSDFTLCDFFFETQLSHKSRNTCSIIQFLQNNRLSYDVAMVTWQFSILCWVAKPPMDCSTNSSLVTDRQHHGRLRRQSLPKIICNGVMAEDHPPTSQI
jgi:hypothetical protein